MILQWDETALGSDLDACCRETVERIALAAPDTSLRLGNALACGAHWVVLRERADLPVWAKPMEPKPRRARKLKPEPPRWSGPMIGVPKSGESVAE